LHDAVVPNGSPLAPAVHHSSQQIWVAFLLQGAKKRGKAAELTREEAAAVAARAGVTARDVTLGLFHALGKVLYNKRLEVGS
jgi:hypothetical protein